MFGEVDGNVDSSARQPEFVRPTLPASVLNTRAGNEMARLQSGPRSSNKPRLLSEHIPVALQTPAYTSIRKPCISLKDQDSSQWEGRPGTQGRVYCDYLNKADKYLASTLATVKSGAQRPTTVKLKTPVLAGSSSHYEVTSHELTREELHTSSSSTVETFGEPRAIWREDSATRKEPPVKKSRKRKSDELEEDELHADVPLRLSQTGFTAIELFSDDFIPPMSAKSSKDLHSQGVTSNITSRRKALPHLSPNDHFFDDDLDSPSTLRKHSDQLKTRTPKSSVARTAIKDEFDTKLDEGRKTIADSEDDDDEVESKKRLNNLKLENDKSADPVLAASTPTAKRRFHSFKDEKISRLPDVVKEKAGIQTLPEQLITTNSEASPSNVIRQPN